VRRAAIAFGSPVVVFALIRPYLASEALSLGIAGSIPVLYALFIAFTETRVDPLAFLSAAGFVLACGLSAATGGGSLPLKLHEAFITGGIGLVLITAAALGRPLPLAHRLKITNETPQMDGVLSAIMGLFLLLHALLHLVLAVSLPTRDYLVVSRAVSWGTIGLGVLALSIFVRHARTSAH
jgi:hypothetical protein